MNNTRKNLLVILVLLAIAYYATFCDERNRKKNPMDFSDFVINLNEYREDSIAELTFNKKLDSSIVPNMSSTLSIKIYRKKNRSETVYAKFISELKENYISNNQSFNSECILPMYYAIIDSTNPDSIYFDILFYYSSDSKKVENRLRNLSVIEAKYRKPIQ